MRRLPARRVHVMKRADSLHVRPDDIAECLRDIPSRFVFRCARTGPARLAFPAERPRGEIADARAR